MDVKSAFLNGFINEEVYVEQPPGFQSFNFPNHVFRLKKALYGLKQAPRAWYERLSKFLLKKGFKMGKIDTTLFIKTKDNDMLLVQIYVDDIIFGATNVSLCEEFSKCMHSEFEMSMMGELNFFLGLQIKQLKEGTFINQAKYIRDLLKRFNMEEAKTMKTPMTSSIKLDMDEKDADFAGCKVERKSTSGTCHFLGHSLASWHSKKQNSVAFDFNLIFEHVPIKCDNTKAINISKNLVQHSRTKHIEIRHHFLRDHAQKGDITLEFVSTKDQLADIFTKPLKIIIGKRSNFDQKSKFPWHWT
uniref:Reverse transcriptase Ty1/copia-type domain-containing protein n=1 Tax=Vitis vinifera TaxID=29760 RepID=A5B241_VITVI|nr:hypothetical protein VITISV_000889 [Vitis vinifera]